MTQELFKKLNEAVNKADILVEMKTGKRNVVINYLNELYKQGYSAVDMIDVLSEEYGEGFNNELNNSYNTAKAAGANIDQNRKNEIMQSGGKGLSDTEKKYYDAKTDLHNMEKQQQGYSQNDKQQWVNKQGNEYKYNGVYGVSNNLVDTQSTQTTTNNQQLKKSTNPQINTISNNQQNAAVTDQQKQTQVQNATKSNGFYQADNDRINNLNNELTKWKKDPKTQEQYAQKLKDMQSKGNGQLNVNEKQFLKLYNDKNALTTNLQNKKNNDINNFKNNLEDKSQMQGYINQLSYDEQLKLANMSRVDGKFDPALLSKNVKDKKIMGKSVFNPNNNYNNN